MYYGQYTRAVLQNDQKCEWPTLGWLDNAKQSDKVKQEEDFAICGHHYSVSMVDDNDVMQE
jgi:hypothetical protein